MKKIPEPLEVSSSYLPVNFDGSLDIAALCGTSDEFSNSLRSRV
jgi:hypothetical protein